MKKAAFLDRDGVINIDRAYVHKIDDFEWIPGVLGAARRLRDAGFSLVVVTNQSGIGRGYYSEEDFDRLTDWMKARFAEAGAPLAGVYFCPHHPEKALDKYRIDCGCRKPRPETNPETPRRASWPDALNASFSARTAATSRQTHRMRHSVSAVLPMPSNQTGLPISADTDHEYTSSPARV